MNTRRKIKPMKHRRYVINYLCPEDEVWHKLMIVEFPKDNLAEFNETVLDAITSALNYMVVSGHHAWEEIESCQTY